MSAKQTVVAATLAAGLSGQALAADCDAALKSDITLFSQDTATSLIYATSLTKEQYNSSMASAGFTLPIKGIDVGADAESQQKAYATLATTAKLEFNEKDRKLLILSRLSDNALAAYQACLNTSSPLRVEARNVSNDAVTVRVRFNPVGVGVVLESLSVDKVAGGEAFDVPDGPPAPGGSIDILFLREPGKRFLVNIKAKVKGVGGPPLSAVVEVPWTPVVSVQPVRVKHSSDDAAYLLDGQSRLRVASTGAPDSRDYEVSAQPGYFIDPGTVSVNMTKNGAACVSGAGYATKSVASDRQKISGHVSFGAPPACGGAATGHLEWQEVYPLVIVDGKPVNPPNGAPAIADND